MGAVILTSEYPGTERSLSSFRQLGGYSGWERVKSTMTQEEVVDLIEGSTLVGKGGAGFPTHKKMRMIREQQETKRYLVINGSEHEPGSIKDKYLLEYYPHKVLEGALIMGYAIEATEIIVAINEHVTASLEHFQQALLEVSSDEKFDFGGMSVVIHKVPDKYIVGEESALLEVIEGREPFPRKKPPFPIQKGLFGSPTLIQNVETVVHLPFIVNYGADAYKSLGINDSGVTLCTLGHEFNHSGVYEVPLGTSIRTILYELGGGLKDGSEIKAVQPGGPSSGFLLAKDFDLPLDAQVLKEHGASLGCAVIKAFSANDCMVQEISKIMDFFAHGSCGQCPECRMETNMFSAIMKQVQAGKGNWKLVEQIHSIMHMVQGKGICGLIKMPVDPLKSGLELFHVEFENHIDEKKCTICFEH
jgi:NADH:ubiquinone oxidoreductase subunit F (NADH-binding)